MRFVVLALLFFGLDCMALNRALYNAYQDVSYSYRGGEMRFSCEHGLTKFKLTSERGARPKLFWYSGRSWLHIEDVMFDDTRITFEGLSRDTGLTLKELVKQVPEITIFNQGFNISPQAYLYKSQHNVKVPYIYSVDMINEKMTASNIEPIIDHVRLDKRKYVLQQAYKSPIQVMTQAQQAEQNLQKDLRQTAINQVLQNFQQELSVITPAYEYETDSSCYLM